MSHALLSPIGTASSFPPLTPQSGASSPALSLASRLAELITREPSLLTDSQRLADALEVMRRSGGSALQVVESSAAQGGAGTAVLVVVVGRDEDRVPAEDEIRVRFGLTRREATVAWCLAHRQSNDEIARALCVSPHTARHHTERVLGKLKVHSRREVRTALLSPEQPAATAVSQDLLQS